MVCGATSVLPVCTGVLQEPVSGSTPSKPGMTTPTSIRRGGCWSQSRPNTVMHSHGVTSSCWLAMSPLKAWWVSRCDGSKCIGNQVVYYVVEAWTVQIQRGLLNSLSCTWRVHKASVIFNYIYIPVRDFPRRIISRPPKACVFCFDTGWPQYWGVSGAHRRPGRHSQPAPGPRPRARTE